MTLLPGSFGLPSFMLLVRMTNCEVKSYPDVHKLRARATKELMKDRTADCDPCVQCPANSVQPTSIV